MRVALKIAYDGRSFYGHQRQPDRRTVEGECLVALKAARIIRDPREAFFRSASRTDRGVSAVGNVIAFNTSLRADAVIGAFNDRARDVWAWAAALVADDFHPRHALERWYRYILMERVPTEALRAAARAFVGAHDFQAFCSEPLTGPMRITSVDVTVEDRTTLIDVRAPSFRRGMVRRIAAAMLAIAREDATLDELRGALAGARRDFGSVPAEPLILMDVQYDIPFRALLTRKMVDDLERRLADLALRQRILEFVQRTTALDRSSVTQSLPA